MHNLAIQLNHPGKEKELKGRRDGFTEIEERLVRKANLEKGHYRKFLCNKGRFLSALGGNVSDAELLFWGEWEYPSWYEPLKKTVATLPAGIHRPFFIDVETKNRLRKIRNTDPFVFGDVFYYSICKQIGKRCQLSEGSVILFGSSLKRGFALDTVFVVGSSTPLKTVNETDAEGIDPIVTDVVLRPTGQYLISTPEKPNLRLYSGTMYFEGSNKPFSYVPCRVNSPENRGGFDRVILPYDLLRDVNLSSNPTIVKYLAEDPRNIEEIWDVVTKLVTEQGFSLGVSFDMPEETDFAKIASFMFR